jgi:glutamine synthetase
VSVETQVPLGRPARDPSAAQDLAARAREDGVRFLLALFVDLTGKPCAKLVPVEAAGASPGSGGQQGRRSQALGGLPAVPLRRGSAAA